jgi:hypothetical protein
LRAYVDFFARRGSEVTLAGGPILPIRDTLGPWPAWFDPCALRDLPLLDHEQERPLGRYEYVWGANLALRAADARRYGPWDESVGRRGDQRGTFEDTEYQDRIRDRGQSIWFCPDASIHHRVGQPQLTPAALLREAYSRGRTEFWRSTRDEQAAGRYTMRRNYIQHLSLLTVNAARCGLYTCLLAVLLRPGVFRKAHASAHDFGLCVDGLRAGREERSPWSILARGSSTAFRALLRVLAWRKA